MSTWSDNRTSVKVDEAKAVEAAKKQISSYNALLSKMASDNDLHAYLALPITQAAIQHWSNVKRLSPEQARVFERDNKVLYVFRYIQGIQFESNKNVVANSILMEHMMRRRSSLEDTAVISLVGNDIGTKLLVKPTKEPVSTSENTKDINANSNLVSNKNEEPSEDCAKQIVNPTSIDVNLLKTKDSTEPITDIKESEHNNKTIWGKLWDIYMWGYESPEGNSFSWKRFLLRVIIDFIIMASLSYIAAVIVTKNVPPEILDPKNIATAT
jgi:hypothetical protein